MSDGIRVGLRIGDPENCMLANMSEECSDCRTVSRGWSPRRPEKVTEEFVCEDASEVDIAEEVFSYGPETIYRLERSSDLRCACSLVEERGLTVSECRAEDGDLHITFHVGDKETVQETFDSLSDQYDEVGLERVVRSADEMEDEKYVLVDADSLTDRQHEVLETAHRMGYFDHPKGANATEVAEELDISRTTFSEHLSAVQKKILTEVVDG